MEESESAAYQGAFQHLAPPLMVAAQQALATFGVHIGPWSIALASAYGLYGFYLLYKQEELNGLLRWIRDRPDDFAEHVVDQKAFKDGFLVVLEHYLKVRSEEKRDLIRSIFLDFAREEDKESYDLERLSRTVESLSSDGLQYLRFLSKEIVPDWDRHIADKMKRFDWQRELTEQGEPLSKFINAWIDKHYDPNSELVKRKWNYIDGSDENNELLEKIYAEKAVWSNGYNEAMAEFVSLGIFRSITESGGGVGGGSARTHYTFTKFGRRLFTVLETGGY